VFAAAVPNNYGRPLAELVQGGCGRWVGWRLSFHGVGRYSIWTVPPQNTCQSFVQPPARQQTPRKPCGAIMLLLLQRCLPTTKL
jgi:hypothetical protein